MCHTGNENITNEEGHQRNALTERARSMLQIPLEALTEAHE